MSKNLNFRNLKFTFSLYIDSPEEIFEITKAFNENCINSSNSTIIKCDEKFSKIYIFDKEKLTVKEAQKTCAAKFNLPSLSSVVTFSDCPEYKLVKNFLIFVTERNQDLWESNSNSNSNENGLMTEIIHKLGEKLAPKFLPPNSSQSTSIRSRRDTEIKTSEESEGEVNSSENVLNVTRRNKKHPRVDVWTGGYSSPSGMIPHHSHGHGHGHGHRHWNHFIPGRNRDCEGEEESISSSMEGEVGSSGSVSSELILTEHHMVNSSSPLNPWSDQKRRYTLCQLLIPKGFKYLWRRLHTTVAPSSATTISSPNTTTVAPSTNIKPKITTPTVTPPLVPVSTTVVVPPSTQPTSAPKVNETILSTPAPSTTKPTRGPRTQRTTAVAPKVTRPSGSKVTNSNQSKYDESYHIPDHCEKNACPAGTMGVLLRCRERGSVREYNLCANASFGAVEDSIDKDQHIVDTVKALVKDITTMRDPSGGDILSFIKCANKIKQRVFGGESFQPGGSNETVMTVSETLVTGFSGILDRGDAWEHIPIHTRTESASSVIETVHQISISVGCQTTGGDTEKGIISYRGEDYRERFDPSYHTAHDHTNYNHTNYDHFRNGPIKMAAIDGSNIQMETFNLENGTISSEFEFPKAKPSADGGKTADRTGSADKTESADRELAKKRRGSNVKFTNSVPVGKAKCGAYVASGIIYQKITGHLRDNLTMNDPSLSINSNLVAFSIRESSKESIKLPNQTRILITLAHLDLINYGDTTDCVFWDFNTASWNGRGCIKISTLSYRNQTVCECDHLTNFAALLDISNRESNDTIKNVLTIICSTISIICLSLTILLFLFVKSLRNRRSVITTNLSICLLSLNLLVLTGFDQTDKVALCRVVSGLAMYSLLSAFSWMLMEGYFLYHMVIIVFRSVGHIDTLWLYLFGYGPPLIILISYIAITGFSGLYEPDFSYL